MFLEPLPLKLHTKNNNCNYLWPAIPARYSGEEALQNWTSQIQISGDI